MADHEAGSGADAAGAGGADPETGVEGSPPRETGDDTDPSGGVAEEAGVAPEGGTAADAGGAAEGAGGTSTAAVDLHRGAGDERSRQRGGSTPQRTGPPVLAVEGLSKSFGSTADAVTAVDDLSLSVAPGEIVGLLGPNGAGKTTAIKCMLGLVVPDAGTVEIAGHDVADRPRAAYEHVDAMLEGARNDYWRLTVRENLRYFAAIRGQDPDVVERRHERLLERFELAEAADTPVRELSRGQKQTASLASALAGDVSIAFLDEPTLGLDVERSLTLRRELVRLAGERGVALVVSSHDMAVIEDVCDRVVIVSDGRVVAEDAVDELLAGFEAAGYRVAARNVDDAALAALRERFEVTAVTRLDGRTRFEVATGEADGFYRLAELMERRGLVVESFETLQPDLGEAFLELTRDASGASRTDSSGVAESAAGADG